MSNRTRRKSLCRHCRSGRHDECQNPGGCKCPKCRKTRKREAVSQALWDRRVEAELRQEEELFEREKREQEGSGPFAHPPINFDALRQVASAGRDEEDDLDEDDLDDEDEDEDWDEEEDEEENFA